MEAHLTAVLPAGVEVLLQRLPALDLFRKREVGLGGGERGIGLNAGEAVAGQLEEAGLRGGLPQLVGDLGAAAVEVRQVDDLDFPRLGRGARGPAHEPLPVEFRFRVRDGRCVVIGGQRGSPCSGWPGLCRAHGGTKRGHRPRRFHRPARGGPGTLAPGRTAGRDVSWQPSGISRPVGCCAMPGSLAAGCYGAATPGVARVTVSRTPHPRRTSPKWLAQQVAPRTSRLERGRRPCPRGSGTASEWPGTPPGFRGAQGRRRATTSFAGGDGPQLEPVLGQVSVPRTGVGRPRARPDHVLADKACAGAGSARRYLSREPAPHPLPPSGRMCRRPRRGTLPVHLSPVTRCPPSRSGGTPRAGRARCPRRSHVAAALDHQIHPQARRAADPAGPQDLRGHGGRPPARGGLQPAEQRQEPGRQAAPRPGPQFRYLNEQARNHQDSGAPVISVDTKKELVGPTGRPVQEQRP